MSASSSSGNNTRQQLSARALFYMCLLAFQFGMQPVLTKMYTPSSVCRSSVIISQEVCKFFICLFMLVISGSLGDAVTGWTISSWIGVAAVPAALYSVQNYVTLIAYQNLDPLTFNVLNQTKTLSAALCCYLIIGRRQSRMQVLALLLLFASALVIEKIVSLDFHDDDTSPSSSSSSQLQYTTRHVTHGVAPVLLASFISGLAGALSQKNLQSASGCGTSGGRNSYLFSMELCVASVIFLSLSLSSSDDGARIARYGFFDGWTPPTLIPIVTNALGGIAVGLVTKYAGSVRKGFALIFGLLLSGVVQTLLSTEGERDEGVNLSKEQIVGGILAAVSLWIHSSWPYVAKVDEVAVGNGHAVKADLPKKSRKARKED